MWIFGSIKNERTSNKKIMFFELFLFDFVGAFFFSSSFVRYESVGYLVECGDCIMCRFRPNSNAHITQQHMCDIYVKVLNVWVCLRVWYSHWAHFWFQPYMIFHSFVIVNSCWCWWHATVTVCECDRVISPCLVKICFIIYLIFLNKTVTWYVSRLSIKMIVNRERVVILVFSCCCCCHCCYWRCHFAHSLELQFKFT